MSEPLRHDAWDDPLAEWLSRIDLRLPAVMANVRPAAPSPEPDIDVLDWEAYPHEAAWPPEGRTGQKLASLHRRLLVAVEGSPAYATEPAPYSEVLWNASRYVYNALSRKKRLVAENFAIFPIDDHGDVDVAEDVRQCLPADVADSVLDGTQR